MEKITADVRSALYIKRAIEVAQTVGVDSMLFRPGLVSGIGGKTGMSVVMLHNHTEELTFDVLGIMRPSDLGSRLNLIDCTKPDSIVTDVIMEKIDDDPTPRRIITNATLKNGRVKVTYAAGSPKAIRAPRRITFTATHEMNVTPDAVFSSLSNANRVLMCDADTPVSISATRGELIASVQDRNNDVYEDVISTVGDGVSFSHRYVLSYFLPLMRYHTASKPLVMSKEGILQFDIDDFTVYQLPKV